MNVANSKLANIYYSQIMNGGDLNKISTIIGDDFTFTIPTHPEVFRGAEGFKKEVSGLHGAFPDVHLDVHHLWCFEDLILGLWTGTGTHTGKEPLSTPTGPLPATGHAFTIEGVSWIRADGVRLRENLANEDTLRIVHNLGVRDFSTLYSNAGASLVKSFQFSSRVNSEIQLLPDVLSETVHFNHPLLEMPASSSAEVRSFFATYWSAFKDVTFRITHAKRADDVNAFRWEFDATHDGEFFGIPPSGRRIHHQGVSVNVISAAGRVNESYINENLIVLIGQMTAP